MCVVTAVYFIYHFTNSVSFSPHKSDMWCMCISGYMFENNRVAQPYVLVSGNNDEL